MKHFLRFVVFITTTTFSQTFTIDNTTINTCDALIYDDGGATGNYSETDYLMTVCADTGSELFVVINSLTLGSGRVGNNRDDLIIYEGSGIGGTVIYDSNIDPIQNIYSTNSGCITIQFIAISGPIETEVAAGFEMQITCTLPETCSDGILNNGELQIDCGGPNCVPCFNGEICEGNIVPNGDFETSIPEVCGAPADGIYGSANQIPRLWHDQTPVQGWFGTATRVDDEISYPTSDYFASCTNTTSIGCMDGSGSVGYWAHFSGSESGEYVQTQLSEPLEAGVEYCVSVRASTLRGFNEGGADTDKLGFWFHNNTYANGSGFPEWNNDNGGEAFMGAGTQVNGTPQVVNPPGQMITSECQDFQYSFCADGGEQYVMIGNFTPGNSASGQEEYISIDNVVVRKSCPLSFDLVINDNGASSSCTGACFDLTAAASNPVGGCQFSDDFTYQWQENGVDIPGATNPTLEICPTQVTTYTVQVTYNAGCSSITLPTDYRVTCCNVNAGGDGSLSLCSSDDPVDLFTLLSGTPDTGGDWTGPSDLTNGDQGTYTPGVNTTGTYTYTVNGNSCSDTAEVVVTQGTDPQLTLDNRLCSADRSSYDVLFTPAPTTSIITTTAGTVSGNSIIDIPVGTNITITLDDNGCTNTFDIMAPDCNCPVIADPTNPNNPTICQGSPTPNLNVDVSTELDVNWYASLTDTTILFSGNPFTPTDTDTGTYTYYAEAVDTSSNCQSNRIAVTLTIVEDITVTELPDVAQCDAYILPPLTAGNYFTETNGGGTPLNAGDEITATQTLYIFEETGTTPNCSDEASFTITIYPTPNPTAPVGDMDTFCGRYTLPPLLAGQSYHTETNGGGEQLNAGDIITENTTLLFLRESNPEGCSGEIAFTVTITEAPSVELESGSICETLTEDNFIDLDTFLDPNEYTFIWFRNGTEITGENNPNLIASESGEYTVTYTNNITQDCSGTASATVEITPGPQELVLELTRGQFADNNGIIARVIGGGSYEYSLDGDTPQPSNRFSNVSLGIHEVTALSLEGCGEITAEIFVVGFPRFFTPNGDSINDFWNVIADFELPEMDIYIFDRYGKFIKKLDPNGPGWDGTFNNEPQPATDYWFTAQFRDGTEEYRSHFTLRR